MTLSSPSIVSIASWSFLRLPSWFAVRTQAWCGHLSIRLSVHFITRRIPLPNLLGNRVPHKPPYIPAPHLVRRTLSGTLLHTRGHGAPDQAQPTWDKSNPQYSIPQYTRVQNNTMNVTMYQEAPLQYLYQSSLRPSTPSSCVLAGWRG